MGYSSNVFMRSFKTMSAWSSRRWAAAVISGAATFLFIAYSTALIENPIFGRSIAPTSWAMPIAIVSSILSGLLLATYVRGDSPAQEETSIKIGTLGGMATFFAVGCPVCNKLVLLALGASGAVQWFAPFQPFLAAIGIGLLAYALEQRLAKEFACSIS